MIPETKLLRSNLRTSRLGLGCSRLHHLANTKERQALLDSAFDLGFRHFDVAPSYGHGINERELGAFLNRRRKVCTVATKFGMQVSPLVDGTANFSLPLARAALGCRSVARRFIPWDERLRELTPTLLERAVSHSLRRLHLDHIHVHFLHEPAPGAETARLIRTLLPTYRRMQKSGVIGGFGLSGSFEVCKTLWHELNEPDLLIQVPEPEWTNDFLPDISYGAIARHGQSFYRTERPTPATAESLVRQALGRRASGVVLVSTTSHEHLRSLAMATAGAEPLP